MINSKGNLEAQIVTLKGKIHAATQEIMVETGNKEFHGIRMEAVWQLVEATIIPIITYGSEAWEPTKKESEQLETIFNKALKTILHLPQQTPTNILLAETGNIPIELIIKKKQETCRSIKLRELSACGRFISHTKATERKCRMTAHGPSCTSQLRRPRMLRCHCWPPGSLHVLGAFGSLS